jgi:hypothetical protein
LFASSQLLKSNRFRLKNQTATPRSGRCGLLSLPPFVVVTRAPRAVVELDGIEPTTSCLQSRRSPN